MIISIIPRSPSRLYITAATEALTPSLRPVKPMSKRDINLTPSQPNIKAILEENNKKVIIRINNIIKVRKELSILYQRLKEKTEPTTINNIIKTTLNVTINFINI